MLDVTLIKAITLDLDDTLWPVWPAIERAEKALDGWLGQHAPMTAAMFANPTIRHDIRGPDRPQGVVQVQGDRLDQSHVEH